jgi:hypothetical protein
MDELPSDRLAQVVDFALFVKTLNERGYPSVRTTEQAQAIEQLFSGPQHTGLYAALMRDRAEERASEHSKPSMDGKTFVFDCIKILNSQHWLASWIWRFCHTNDDHASIWRRSSYPVAI